MQDGELRDARGNPFVFEILLNQSGSACATAPRPGRSSTSSWNRCATLASGRK